MAKFRTPVVTLRYCNLTEEDPNYGKYKVTAEIPRSVFSKMVLALTQEVARQLDRSDMPAKDIDLCRKSDVENCLRPKTDEENPDIVLIEFKANSPEYFTLLNENGTKWEGGRIFHGAVGAVEFGIKPGVAQGKAYVSRYLNSVVIHENGKGGEVVDFGSDDGDTESEQF